jgi:tetratricopeptide (TPR) repeat protein
MACTGCAVRRLAICLILVLSNASPVSSAEEPGKPQADMAGFRLWSDVSGVFILNAQFIELKSGEVLLKGIDGQLFAIAFDRLCADDKAWVTAEVAKRAGQEPAAVGTAGNERGADAAAANAAAGKAPAGKAPAAAPKPEARTRLAMFGEFYAALNQSSEQVLDIQTKLLAVLHQLQPLMTQYQSIEGQIQQELVASQPARRAYEQLPNTGGQTGGLSTPTTASFVAASNRQLTMLQNQKLAILEPLGKAMKEKESLEKKLAQTIAQGEQLGEQLIWFSDPFDRLQLGNQDSAVEALQTAITVQDGRYSSPFLHLALGLERMRLRQYQAASAEFQTAAALGTAVSARLVSISAASQAMLLDRSGQVGRSRAMFNTVARSAADPGSVRLFYANALLAHGEQRHAMLELKQGLTASPNDPRLHEAMARLLVSNPKPAMPSIQDAVEHARKACKLTKSPSWTFSETLALALAAAGDFRGAAESAREALELAPAEATAMLQGNLDEYERAALRGPADPPAAKAN